MQNTNYAPVALFTYSRLKNTVEVVEALKNNYLAKETILYIFSDAPKKIQDKEKVDEVRRYLKTIEGFREVRIIERPYNYYIEKNITEGVTEIINAHGKIVVLEDDGITHPYFLNFINDALNFYKEEKKVMSISTFNFLDPQPNNKTFFLKYSESSGGGWATWKDRWDLFQWFQEEADGLSGLSEENIKDIQLNGNSDSLGFLKLNPIPWDICWNIAIIKNNGLVLFPPVPLLKNNGLDNGTHFNFIHKITNRIFFNVEFKEIPENIIFEKDISENKLMREELEKYYGKIKESINKKTFIDYTLEILVKLKVTKFLKKILNK